MSPIGTRLTINIMLCSCLWYYGMGVGGGCVAFCLQLEDDLELRRKVDIHEIEERKNQHINDLMKVRVEHYYYYYCYCYCYCCCYH